MAVGSVNYASPVQVNGYACKNCSDVDLAAKYIDPAHPRSGPLDRNAAQDPTRQATDPVKVAAARQDVSRGIGLDNRIGRKFLHAGPGYGGSCFPKDTLALLKTGEDAETPLRIVEAVVQVNDHRKRAMGRKVIAALDGDAKGKTVALLGLTFKPNTDDMRDAPAIAIAQCLGDAEVSLRGYDPEGMEAARLLLPGLTFCRDAYDAAAGADAVVIVTEWDAFRALDLTRLKQVMSTPVFIDLRNVYRRDAVERAGFAYSAVGQT